MSRVGKNPVEIPSGVKVDVQGRSLQIVGALGKLSLPFSEDVEIAVENNKVVVKPIVKNKRGRAMWGMYRALVSNMVTGVSKGYSLRLEIQGVGFRAAVDNQFLTLFLGFSHEIKYAIPEGVKVVAEKPTALVVSGFDRQLVGQVAAEIRKFRMPEPYKGKGIRFEGQKIRMKEGKKK